MKNKVRENIQLFSKQEKKENWILLPLKEWTNPVKEKYLIKHLYYLNLIIPTLLNSTNISNPKIICGK